MHLSHKTHSKLKGQLDLQYPTHFRSQNLTNLKVLTKMVKNEKCDFSNFTKTVLSLKVLLQIGWNLHQISCIWLLRTAFPFSKILKIGQELPFWMWKIAFFEIFSFRIGTKLLIFEIFEIETPTFHKSNPHIKNSPPPLLVSLYILNIFPTPIFEPLLNILHPTYLMLGKG